MASDTAGLTGPIANDGAHRRGLLDRLFDLPDRLPGSALAWYAILAAGILAVAEAAGWLAGVRPVGQLESAFLIPATAATYLLMARHVLATLAREAFEAYRPALDPGSSAGRDLGRALTSAADGPALAVIAAFELVIAGSWALSPAANTSIPALWIDAVITWALWLSATGAFALLVYQTVRQIRTVVRLHALAVDIDLFQPGPINAFSRLTVTMAFVLLPLMAFALLTEQSYFQVPALGLLAVGAFVLPLRGMHSQLVEEKARLLADTADRLELVRGRIHAAVDSDDLDRTVQLGTALSTLLAERDLILRLSTWPWTTTVFRGFASAVGLPILVWLVIRVLERLIS